MKLNFNLIFAYIGSFFKNFSVLQLKARLFNTNKLILIIYMLLFIFIWILFFTFRCFIIYSLFEIFQIIIFTLFFFALFLRSDKFNFSNNNFIKFRKKTLIFSGLLSLILFIGSIFDPLVMDISIFNTIFFDPGSEGGAVGNNKMFSLNLICASIGTGLTELSFLGFLKIIFFILFLLLHIGFLYFEYLDINSKKNSDSHHYMQSNLLDHIKKAAAYFLSGAGGASSYITITNEYQRKQTENLIKENLAKSKEELKKVENEQVSNNMHHKLHIDRIDRTHKNLTDIKKEKSELMRLIEENKAKHKTGSALISTADLRKAESRVQLLDLAEKRVDIELNQDITCGVKFATEIKKQTEEKNLLNLINEDVHKSTIFDFDAL